MLEEGLSWSLSKPDHHWTPSYGLVFWNNNVDFIPVCHDIWFLDRMYRIFQDQGVTLQLGSLDQQSIDGINNGMNGFSVSQNSILPSPEPLQNGEVTTQVDSSDQPPMDPSNNGQNVVTAEGNITEVTSSKEGRRKRQAREHRQTGGRIEITREDILKHSEKRRKVAAWELKVSISTLRRNCRRYGITRWPPRNIENVYPFSLSPVENQGQTLQNTNLPSSQASAGVARIKPAFQDADMVTIKVKYANGMFRIPLSLSSTLVELQQEVTKRLNQLKQEAGTYLFEYKDEEEDLVTIACDEDLQSCIRTSRSPGKPPIVVQLKAI
ncbi:hypothetical protein Vadar_002791 [Vaccinium darrowii]|uniref:Uncharacterized protein n=1 Tax=Vaccinium darrowii TaxID=229202 RepID=A0ACB7YBV8_9ERIC|nr:hypothetical protein Vadar_002791 [Vaccinium darrowii]